MRTFRHHLRQRAPKVLRLLAFGVLIASAPAFAADEVGMFVDVKLNQMERGEFAAYRSADGDFMIRLSDLPTLGLRADINLPRVRIAGETGSFVSLRDLGATTLVLDTAKMLLTVELPPELFDKTSIDIAAQNARNTLAAELHSGFLNYRLADAAYGPGTPTRTLATELGLRWGSVLLLNQSVLHESGNSTRYLTQLVYDRPEVQQRYIGGDFNATSGNLGSTQSMGGFNLSKVYSLSPYLIRQPLAGFAGMATSPSQVEVRVGGVPVAYSQVSAGPFELQNLAQYGGASDVQVVVRDALGREQVYTSQFYYSDQSLREGLHEYSYSLGKVRTNAGQTNDNYGTTAFSGFHRFGYNDAVTLGARAEGADGLTNVGLEALWRSNQLGAIAGGVSSSDYAGHVGNAAMLAYTYQQKVFGLQAVARQYDDHYATLDSLSGNFNRRGEYGASLSWTPNAWRSFGLNHTLTETRNQGSARTTALSYHETLSQASFLYATLQRTVDDIGAQPNTSLFVGWLYRFGGKFTASVNVSKDETGQQTITTQLAKDLPQGEGLGYRVGWTGTQPQNTDRLNGFAQWNLPALSLSMDSYTVPAQGSSADYRELAAAGSVAFAGSGWGFSRQITDSFAIVQMGAKVPDVRVMSNSQEIGVSDSNGQVISPFVGSFYESRISVDDKDVPLEYVMNKDFYTVTPAYRSGVSVNFGLRRVHGLDGVVRLGAALGGGLPDGKLITLTQGGKVLQEFQIGRDGHFYIENIVPGDYRGEITVAERTCHFALRFPDTQDIVYTLPGELVCE